jgi:hypothetical protein
MTSAVDAVGLGEAIFLDWLGLEPDALLSQRLRQHGDDVAAIARLQLRVAGADTSDADGPERQPSADHLKASLARRLGLAPRPFWPEDAPYALAVTHDIDRIFASFHRLKWSRDLAGMARDIMSMRQRDEWPRNPFYNFERLFELARDLDVKVALYVLQERRRWAKSLTTGEIQHSIGVYRLEQIADQLARYAAAGHEVGVHGSFDAYGSVPALRAEIAALVSAGLPRPEGVRNHYLNYDEVETPRAQRENEILYDSTMGFNFRSGFRCRTCFPFSKDGVIELPFELMDSALWFEFADARVRAHMVREVQAATAAAGGVLVVNFHLHYLNQEVFPDRVGLLRDIIARARADGAWIATPSRIVRHWSGRLASGS